MTPEDLSTFLMLVFAILIATLVVGPLIDFLDRLNGD